MNESVPLNVVHHQCAIRLILFVVFATTVNGCAVGYKSFSLDSNSKVPFFGLELRERKPKSAAPTYNSISRTYADQSHIETAVQMGDSKSRSFLNRGAKPLVIAEIPTAVANGSRPAPRDVSRAMSQPSQSLILPVTNLRQSPTDRRSSTDSIDFQ